MLVVSNTSPVSNLAIVNHLHLLRQRYGRVIVPERVKLELDALSHDAGKSRVQQAFADGWLVVQAPPDDKLSALYEQSVDPGEAHAIALAGYLKADKLIIDDRIGRELAREHGVPVAGLLGELLHAKRTGRLDCVKSVMKELQTEARFFIREDLRELILREAGE
ncbi:MAG: nucleic acid-binding protein [Verrucomicrobiaceae bacterium]|nr:nucleic acid-binding protein [Verrucomicrobiaceae bacterium]